MSTLEENFRVLRKAWLNEKVKPFQYDRFAKCESFMGFKIPEQVVEAYMRDLKKLYDEDTEELISGNERSVDPESIKDIYLKRPVGKDDKGETLETLLFN
jgi:hypothetical protein